MADSGLTDTPEPSPEKGRSALGSTDETIGPSGGVPNQFSGGTPPTDPQREGSEEIRYGSPFAVDPAITTPLLPPEPEEIFDVGPLRYTAMGAVAASAMVILFASVAAWWFPGGGTLIAGLGSVLAIFGLFSHYRLRAVGCLAIHLMLFMISYSRALA